jgi:hypothetical protein
LAGTDGEKAFNAVFEKEARIVAVLLRPEWGHTAWTRIEETAIRNRAHEQGYDFTTFIVTKLGTSIPDWLPRTRIWYNLERFGPDGAAAALEARVQDRGGIAVQETLADRAARLQRAQDLKQRRDAFHRSSEGVEAAREACRRLVNDLKSNPELLRSIGCSIQDVYGGVTMLLGRGVVLTVQAHFPYVNSLENTALVAQFYDGVPRLPKLIAAAAARLAIRSHVRVTSLPRSRTLLSAIDRSAYPNG